MLSLWLKLSAKPFTTVILLSLVLFLNGTWLLPLIDRDEPRFAQASREMLQRDDLVIPWFNGQYRFDKPPLIYWCQMGCYRLLGENTFSARLPSVLFATATALLLLAWGRRLGDENTAFCAAIIFVTCLQVLIHARLAVADMPMVFFATAAVWSGWEMTRPQGVRSALWWWLFFVSLALGFLAKGPIAWFSLGGLLIGKLCRPADFRLSVKSLLPGLLVTVSLVALWGIPALVKTHGEFFSVGIGHHVVYRSFGVMEGHGVHGILGWLFSTPFYFVGVFLSFFPWAFMLPKALRSWWPTRKQDTLGWYLLVQIALVFGIFTVVRTKLPHYTLPAFPCLSLWLARWITKGEKWLALTAKWALAMSLFALLLTSAGFVAARPLFVSASLWQQVRPMAKENMAMAAIDFQEPSLVWEFRQVLTNHMESLPLAKAAQFLQREQPLVLVLPTSDFKEPLPTLASNAVKVRVIGLDTVEFKKRDLTAIIRQ
jgi:4-amino-4-deoxy-L-arabinose transferase-like glycosyltransferase